MSLLQPAGPTVRPDPSRLVARPFFPGSTNFGGARQRLAMITERVRALDPGVKERILSRELERAEEDYRDIVTKWEGHYRSAADQHPALLEIEDTDERRLIGAYLTQGYAYEGVALTNPSMVPLGEADAGSQRFVMSTRAIGEGHLSSIGFMTGTAGSDGKVEFDDRGLFASNGHRRQATYELGYFEQRLRELGVDERALRKTLEHLTDRFDGSDLAAGLEAVGNSDLEPAVVDDTVKNVHWLATSNYEIEYDDSVPIPERLISPDAPVESRGMEDARFVRFREDDGTERYFATYSAYDGRRVLPQLIMTEDFTRFRIATMSGPMARNKGLAIFPRRIEGGFAALSRHDNESIYVMRSNDVRNWANAELVLRPEYEWEAVQIGNCGSPLETEEGWLVITHGVGPMRRYVLGAVLLDLDRPSKVLARLAEPLLEPNHEESDGLVPNVLYSCGGMLHAGNLVLPYGWADYGIGVAAGPVDQILAAMG